MALLYGFIKLSTQLTIGVQYKKINSKLNK